MSGTTAPLRAVPYDRYNGTIGAIFSPKQTISLELVKNKDEDINSLLAKLIDNSPYYVNMECRIWFDQEYEDYLIKKYGKRKLSLSSWD